MVKKLLKKSQVDKKDQQIPDLIESVKGLHDSMDEQKEFISTLTTVVDVLVDDLKALKEKSEVNDEE